MLKDNLLSISWVLFRTKKRTHDWNDLTDKQKEKYFFIFNRYFSKEYIEKSFLLNNKNVDQVSAMDTWYYYMFNKTCPENFWTKIEKEKSIMDKNDINLLLSKLELDKKEDLEYLIKNYPDIINNELKILKSKN